MVGRSRVFKVFGDDTLHPANIPDRIALGYDDAGLRGKMLVTANGDTSGGHRLRRRQAEALIPRERQKEKRHAIRQEYPAPRKLAAASMKSLAFPFGRSASGDTK